MASFRLNTRLRSTLLTDAWAGTTVTGRPVVAHARKEPWAKATDFPVRYGPLARGWQGLRQPGVMPLVEAGQAQGGAVWIVEEYHEGESLRSVLAATLAAKVPLSVPESVAVAVQLARGLVALGKLIPPLHHGDVCASSVMVGTDGECWLTKLGVAQAHSMDPELGPARAELYTLAPEELTGANGPATDVFRLGLVLLECLSSRAVFGGSTFAEVRARLEKYPGLTPKHLGAFPAVAELLSAMLAKEPGQRPTPADIDSALTRVLGEQKAPAVAASAIRRLFPNRQSLLKSLDGTGEALVLTALSASSTSHTALGAVPNVPNVGATNADGSVTLGKVTTRRMTGEQVALAKDAEASEAAKEIAAEWSARHANDDGNPRDFALAQLLLEQRKLSIEQADQALQHAQGFGSTLFSALTFFGAVDEDEALPLSADLLRQRYLTGPQLLTQGIGPANASLLPRVVAEEWQVLPVKAEGGGLTVAIADLSRLDALDAVKKHAKVRSVVAIRATERTITEGLLRVYEGKASPPEWLRAKTPGPRALDPSTLPEFKLPSASPPVGLSFEGLEGLGLPPPPAPAPLSPPTGARPSPSLPPLPDIEFHLGDSEEPPTDVSPLPVGLVPHASPGRMIAHPLPSAPVAAPAPASSPPTTRPVPSGPNTLEVASRIIDAVLSLVPDRGPEAARMVAFVRSVAKQSGASGAPLEQVRLAAKAVVVAALIEGKRSYETPSLPAVSAVLGPAWGDFETMLRPLLDQDEAPRGDARAVVLSLCFGLASKLGAVPGKGVAAKPALDAMRSGYASAAIAAVEAVLAR